MHFLLSGTRTKKNYPAPLKRKKDRPYKNVKPFKNNREQKIEWVCHNYNKRSRIHVKKKIFQGPPPLPPQKKRSSHWTDATANSSPKRSVTFHYLTILLGGLAVRAVYWFVWTGETGQFFFLGGGGGVAL